MADRTIRMGECARDPVNDWYLELTNGWASGCGWYEFTIRSGPHAGKTVWFCEDTYEARVDHDQYETFNSSDPHPDHPNDEPMGGHVIENIHGLDFEAMGIDTDDDVLEPPRPEYIFVPA